MSSAVVQKTVQVFRVINKDNFHQVCRCCLSQDILNENILELVHDNVVFVYIFSQLLGTKVDDSDNMPKSICQDCLMEIINFYNFKKKFDKVGQILSAIAPESKETSVQPPLEAISDNPNSPEVMNSDFHNNVITEDPLLESPQFEVEISAPPQIEETESPSPEPPRKRRPCLFACSCCQTFSSIIELATHRKQMNHSGPPRFWCKICNKSYSRVTFRRHRVIHEKGNQFECRFCGKKYALRHSFQRHERNHIGERKHFCEFCNEGFLRPNQLREHRRKHTGEKPHLCERCGETFRTTLSYNIHKRKHHELVGRKCKICGTIDCPRHLRFVKKFYCDLCGSYFRYERSFNLHFTRQHLLQRLHCSECGFDFVNPIKYAEHFEEEHGEGRFLVKDEVLDPTSLQCKVCEKVYTDQSVLDCHRLTHCVEKKSFDPEMKIYCQVCDKWFVNEAHFSVHFQKHNEKPYSCDKCSMKFKYLANWKKHHAEHLRKTRDQSGNSKNDV